jgi:hypothetical protein
MLRVAVVSTPRSGSTWLSKLLAVAYDLPDRAVHNPSEVDWQQLPPGLVLQLHWRRTPPFLARLEENGFRVLTVARHPLDVLISVLHFALHDRSTARWLEGEEGNERAICGVMPCSAAFRAYATGRRAAALLSVSREWWADAAALRVRYEDLVARPHDELERLADALGEAPRVAAAEALAATTIPRLRQRLGSDHHCWQGQPGLWRGLLPADHARAIADAHADSLADFGYVCDPDSALGAAEADANWVRLVWSDLAEKLPGVQLAERRVAEARAWLAASEQALGELRGQHATLTGELATVQTELTAARAELAAERQGLAEAQQELASSRRAVLDLTAQLAAAQRVLATVEGLGPFALGVAHRLRRLSAGYPRLSGACKRLLRLRRRLRGVVSPAAPEVVAGQPVRRRAAFLPRLPRRSSRAPEPVAAEK